MRIHYLQHVPFEGPAAIRQWAGERRYSLQSHRLFEKKSFDSDNLPGIDQVDALIVMGGPMGVADVEEYPWLRAEINYIREFIDSGKPLLGICLGAQLIAHALNAAVTRNTHKEIGWFPLQIHPQSSSHRLGRVIPNDFPVFHWHGDTFAIPEGAIPLASSEACQNQGFILNKSILGLQFHLEATAAWAQRLITHCSDELDGSTYVQSSEQMLAQPERFAASNRVMTELLDAWTSVT